MQSRNSMLKVELKYLLIPIDPQVQRILAL